MSRRAGVFVTQWFVFLILLTARAAWAEGRVADIIGPVAKIRIDSIDGDRAQGFITDPKDIAAVLKAIGLEQHPSRLTPPPNANFSLNLNFFDPTGVPGAILSFYGPVGNRNRLSAIAFSVADKGSITIANLARLRAIIDRYAPKEKSPTP